MAATTTTESPRLKQRFESELKKQLQTELGLGNVMQVLPGIHPYIAISDQTIPGHSTAFRDHAATPEALDRALVAAKALALTAIDVLSDPELLKEARAEFAERRAAGTVKGRQ